MKLKSYIEQALLNLINAKLRSLLAILGVLVGTAAVVALLSCGQLATEKALAQFKSLGTNLLAVSVYQRTANHLETTHDKVSLTSWRNMPSMIPDVLAIAPYAVLYQSLSFQGVALRGVVVGADDSLSKILQVKIGQGHFISFVENFERVCVIGHGLAQLLERKGLGPVLNKQLRIGQVIYTVVGIADNWKENAFFNEDINQAVIIPVTGLPFVSKENKINNAIFLLKPATNIDAVVSQIKQLILRVAPESNVFPRSAKQLVNSMEKQGHIFTLLLGIIGGISLLVGGIGVMNIMLVSVTERRKEIGIRKAVGAKNSEIQALFLVEAVILSLTGGCIGVISGLIFTWIMAYFSGWSFTFFWSPPLAGFLVSVSTGIFFGFYPAKRASQLEPMVSLRSE